MMKTPWSVNVLKAFRLVPLIMVTIFALAAHAEEDQYPEYDDDAEVRRGVFKVGDKFYYSTGDIFCSFKGPRHLEDLTSESQRTRAMIFPDIPAVLDDGGLCTEAMIIPWRRQFAPGTLTLTENQSIETEKLRLQMQGDGNLVLSRIFNGALVWKSSTNENCTALPCRLVFQTDGNLVILDNLNRPIWHTATKNVAKFIVRDEEDYMKILNNNGIERWSTPHKGFKIPLLPPRLEFKTGQLTLKQGESIETDQHKLVMQGDGNLCVNKKDKNKNVWCSATNKACGEGKDNCAAIFRSDGNFVIAQDNGNDCPVWATDTSGANSRFIFRDETPWLRIVGGLGEKKWESSEDGKLKTCKRQWRAGGLTLAQGESVELDEHKLVMQTDGNLVMRRKSDNADVWRTATNVICENGAQICKMTYQEDGNLVIRRADGCAAWATNTAFKNATINIRDKEPYIKIVGKDGTVHWQTPNKGDIKSCLPNKLAWSTTSGFKLTKDQSVEVQNFKLVMQGDGNLCVNKKADNKNIWCSGSSTLCGENGIENCSVNFQGDGNLVITRASGCPVWATQTSGPNSTFIFRDANPQLRIVGKDEAVHWDSNKTGKKLSCEAYEGLFMVGEVIYYSNRNNAQYCSFPSWDQFVIQTGKKNTDGIPKWGGLPWWRNNGSCGERAIPAGLFRIGGVIYNSNGWAYCAFTSWDNYVDCAERNDLNGVDWYSAIPSVMINHGGCTCLPSKLEWGPGGLSLGPNQQVETKHRKLVMQGDGNLCVYNKDTGGATWCSYTNGACGNGPNCYMAYQGDGNLVVYKYSGGAPWDSKTKSKNPGNMVLRDDAPALRIKNGKGDLIWSRP